MNLSTDEWNVLAIRHGCSFESAQLRDRLLAEGYHFCSSCKTAQPSEAFTRSTRGRGGRKSRCKGCSRRTNQTRGTGYVAHGPRDVENSARYREANLDTIRERHRENYQQNRESILERQRERQRGRPRVRTYDPDKAREHYTANRESILEDAAQWRADNPETVVESRLKNLNKRKELGMTGSQANYMADASEFYDEWRKIRYKRIAG